MSLAEMQARAEQLRGELSALRVEKESALQGGQDAIAEAALAAEVERLERERDLAKAEVTAIKSGGTVEDALAAMRAAAAEQEPDGSADLSTPLVVTEPESANKPEAPLVVEEAPEAPLLLPPVDLSTDAPKADGEQ